MVTLLLFPQSPRLLLTLNDESNKAQHKHLYITNDLKLNKMKWTKLKKNKNIANVMSYYISYIYTNNKSFSTKYRKI